MCILALTVPHFSTCMQAINAKIAFKADKDAFLKACLLVQCVPVIGTAINRYQLRKALDIREKFILDKIVHLLCDSCAVTQEWQTVMQVEYKDSTVTIFNMPS
mmetsp:Transcript_22077/g.40229  ORF Transcript_22077/g.40229 Transcript_22077/m.40229 type:complete len:103 (+) Transcript_22077:193-501(+)